jgi:hypothetical protein
MSSNSKQSWHETALLVILPVLFAISGSANADPDKTQQAAISAASLTVSNTGTDQRTWHWKSDPEAYQPDGLSDYSEDFADVGRQPKYQIVVSEPVTRREAHRQTEATQAQ